MCQLVLEVHHFTQHPLAFQCMQFKPWTREGPLHSSNGGIVACSDTEVYDNISLAAI